MANNSYARGIVSTLANDCIGTGPRLQMLTDDAEANRVVEREFMRWADSVSLAEKLRTMRMARAESGEAFAMLVANPQVDSPVNLDLRLVEADQVATPFLNQFPYRANAVDGIVFDAYGNPVEYHVLKSHPGDRSGRIFVGLRPRAGGVDGPLFPGRSAGAEPGHSRDHAGTAALRPTAALHPGGRWLRRKRRPTLQPCCTRTPRPTARPIRSNRWIWWSWSGGWPRCCRAVGSSRQVHAEQPPTGFSEFAKEILNEICRCLNMPFNVAYGNSSGYNYASGRLDHQTYYKSIRVDQSQLGLTVLDRVLRAWLDEAILISDLLPLWMRATAFRDLDHQWFWDGQEHVDPGKRGQRPGHSITEPYDHLGLRVRPTGAGLGKRDSPTGQRGGLDERTRADTTVAGQPCPRR